MTANGRHIGGVKSGRRGTPPEWVEMARVALGGHIDLDPMSEPVFNQVVKADRIFTEEDDCFTKSWDCRTLFINPHGGRVVEAWRKLCSELCTQRTRSAMWIGFSVEQLNLLADEEYHPDDFSKLTVRQRIDFTTIEPMRSVRCRDEVLATLECGHLQEMKNRKQRHDTSLRCSECECAAPEPLGNPTHSNYVVGIGIDPDLFELAFAGRGRFSHGRLALPRAENIFGAA